MLDWRTREIGLKCIYKWFLFAYTFNLEIANETK